MILFVLLPSLLFASSIAEKKAAASQKESSKEMEVQTVNDKLFSMRKELEVCLVEASELAKRDAPDEEFAQLLQKTKVLKMGIAALQDQWRESAVMQARRDEDGYALWDQEETTLGQLVMEYGSPDFLYVVPPELSAMKLSMHSAIPIPREAWGNVLEIVLMQSGIGVKKVGPYARQLYVLKQDYSAIQSIVSRSEDLTWVAPGSRLFFLFSPPIEQVKSVFQFFEKFSDSKQTFIHQVGGKIGLVGSKEEIEKLLSLYSTVWQGQEGKTAKVVSVTKMQVREMEKILTTFFGDAADKNKPPFARADQEGLSVFPLGQSNTLVLIGSKDSVDRAESIVKETEEQLQDPAEMTVYLYQCKHSDPVDLAQVLEKVYVSLIHAGAEGPTKETDFNFSAQNQGAGRVPDGYPPTQPLVVSPPPMRPGLQAQLEVERGYSEHFIPDPKTGSLLMTVRRDVLERVKELLKKLDVPKKMVEIEVLLFERRLNTRNNFGLNLLRLGQTRNGVQYTPRVGPDISISKGLDSAAHGIMQFFFHGPAHKYTPKFDIAYNFLMTLEDIQLNNSPSVTAVNQTPAMITIVEERSINNGAAPVDTNKGTTFEKSFSRVQYGTIIKMIPTIHMPDPGEEKGRVTLKTDITFDTPKTEDLMDDRPLVDRRHVENEVCVIDGETIILGGLRRKTKQDVQEKVPFLGEIPGVGKLFGTTNLHDRETEMFFFITPHIIYDSAEQLRRLRAEDLKKRPGDLPEFVQKVADARDKDRRKIFRQSLRVFTSP
ncbi:MAG: type II secretion system protein GspD [Verrucomicrobia bacterium]|nr:type II secretion system protein GspD [Verrucomicrobiota bacterium]